MKLNQHFNQHLSSDFANTKEQLLQSILNDDKAMAELDQDYEVWPGVDLHNLGRLLAEIAILRMKTQSPRNAQEREAVFSNNREIAAKRASVSELIEAAWFATIVDYTEIKLGDVDLHQLIDAENTPEPAA